MSIGLLFGFGIASAQTLGGGGDKILAPKDSVAKRIFGYSALQVFYDYKYVIDPQVPTGTGKSITVLNVGDKYNSFCDYNKVLSDSALDVAAKHRKSFLEGFSTAMPLMKNIRFTPVLICDKEANEVIVQDRIGLTNYQYKDKMPQIQWELQDGDTTIVGYACKKAKTHFGGRDYIAWYSPDVALPYGPYKFSGLPGLIFKITEVASNFDFTLVGIKRPVGFVPIYNSSNKDILRLTREKFITAYKNYCANPAGALANVEGVYIDSKTLSGVKPKPYNPIELE